MKAIILTGKFGMGHVSAAKAIKEELDIKYGQDSAVIVDLVTYLFPTVSHLIYKGFDATASKCPPLYNGISKLDAHSAGVPMKGWFAKRFDSLVKKYNPDIVISTWPVASKYIGFYKSEADCKLPFVTCITDISAQNVWIADETDAYLVGNEGSKMGLVKKGVPADKIHICGIPVRPQFKKSDWKDETAKNSVLIMGGGLGIIPGIDVMLEKLSGNVDVTVIAGNNAKLEKYIKDKYENVKVIGFTNHVDEYLEKSDVVITKAGGISMFEAIHSKTPLLVLKPFLEQEKENAKFIEKMNIGMVMDRKARYCCDLFKQMTDRQVMNVLKHNMSCISSKCNANSIPQIVDLLVVGE